MRRWLIAGLVGLAGLGFWGAGSYASSVAVRFSEGVTRGFPILRAVSGERLAVGELSQVAHGDRVESRMVFRFGDGSLYDETTVFSQHDVFTLMSYHVVQRGPSFPETIDASIDRESGNYRVRYRADEDSAEEVVTGRYDMPADVYNGMLGIVMKNLPVGQSVTVQVLAFTPKPRAVNVLLSPAGVDQVQMGDRAILATRYVVKPQLGLLASLLVTDLAPMHCWIVEGEAPGFVRFQGPLFFLGPVWRIELN